MTSAIIDPRVDLTTLNGTLPVMYETATTGLTYSAFRPGCPRLGRQLQPIAANYVCVRHEPNLEVNVGLEGLDSLGTNAGDGNLAPLH